MRREYALVLCAIQFLTRLPVPRQADFQSDWVYRSARYFPLAGQLVGFLTALVFSITSHVWQGLIPAVLTITAGVLITGAFHEDGLADTVDGLGGGQDVQRRLAIMKDSRVGSYGVLALILCIGIKVAALASVAPAIALVTLIAAHGCARGAAVVAMRLPYVGDRHAAKTPPAQVARLDVFIALALSAWPLFLLRVGSILPSLALGSLLALAMAMTARRLVGGQTGDILGAVEQMFETGFLLGAAMFMPMIK